MNWHKILVCVCVCVCVAIQAYPRNTSQELVRLDEETRAEDEGKSEGVVSLASGGWDEEVNECVQRACYEDPVLVHQLLDKFNKGKVV